MLEKLEQFVLLKDIYGALLTEKQSRILKDYYENDFSLSEIADDMQISRQAVYDLVKRSEHQLLQYETKLGLLEKFRETRRCLDSINELLADANPTPADLDEVRRILQQTIKLL